MTKAELIAAGQAGRSLSHSYPNQISRSANRSPKEEQQRVAHGHLEYVPRYHEVRLEATEAGQRFRGKGRKVMQAVLKPLSLALRINNKGGVSSKLTRQLLTDFLEVFSVRLLESQWSSWSPTLSF